MGVSQRIKHFWDARIGTSRKFLRYPYQRLSYTLDVPMPVRERINAMTLDLLLRSERTPRFLEIVKY
jgi:hypothetical protein